MITKHRIKKSYYPFLLTLILLIVFLNPASVRAEEEGKWGRNIALGINMSRGNIDNFLLTANFLAEMQRGKIKIWRLGIDGVYGKTNEEKTEENALAFIEYRHGVKNKDNLYWSVTTSLFVDTVAKLDYRFAIGPALGYLFFKDNRSQLSFEIGPSYTREKIESEPAEDYAGARIAERYERILSKTAKVWQTAEYLPDLRDRDNFLLNAELGTEAALNSYLGLRVKAQNKYDNEPADNKKKNDFSLICSLNYKF